MSKSNTFKSGFLIFVPTNKCSLLRETVNNNLLSSSISSSNNIIKYYHALIINSKQTLFKYSNTNDSNNIGKTNKNALKYIFFKLGLYHKEILLINKGLEDLKFFDMEVSNLLMKYILEVGDNIIKKNQKISSDCFYISIIKLTIKYIISLIRSKITNQNISHSIYSKNKNMHELILASKYLEVLRIIENDIFSLSQIGHYKSFNLHKKIRELKVITNKINFTDDVNIEYFKKEVFYGRISNSQYYLYCIILPKHSSLLVNKNIPSIKNVFIRIFNELFIYKIIHFLIDSNNNSNILRFILNILRNIGYNVNMFLKRIAFKTKLLKLRNRLLSHLEHMSFISNIENDHIKTLNYIVSYYKNDNFSICYKQKVFRLLNNKEYIKLLVEIANQEKSLYNDNNEYYPLSEIDEFILSASSIIFNTNLHNLHKVYSYSKVKNNKSNEYFTNSSLIEIPFLSVKNMEKLEQFLEEDNFYSIFHEVIISNSHTDRSILFNQYYERLYNNSEVDDFGMNKKDYLKENLYINSNYSYLIRKLKYEYFSQNEDMIDNLNRTGEVFDCKFCVNDVKYKESNEKNDETDFFNYSNLSYEEIKDLPSDQVLRVNFDIRLYLLLLKIRSSNIFLYKRINKSVNNLKNSKIELKFEFYNEYKDNNEICADEVNNNIKQINQISNNNSNSFIIKITNNEILPIFMYLYEYNLNNIFLCYINSLFNSCFYKTNSNKTSYNCNKSIYFYKNTYFSYNIDDIPFLKSLILRNMRNYNLNSDLYSYLLMNNIVLYDFHSNDNCFSGEELIKSLIKNRVLNIIDINLYNSYIESGYDDKYLPNIHEKEDNDYINYIENKNTIDVLFEEIMLTSSYSHYLIQLYVINNLNSSHSKMRILYLHQQSISIYSFIILLLKSINNKNYIFEVSNILYSPKENSQNINNNEQNIQIYKLLLLMYMKNENFQNFQRETHLSYEILNLIPNFLLNDNEQEFHNNNKEYKINSLVPNTNTNEDVSYTFSCDLYSKHGDLSLNCLLSNSFSYFSKEKNFYIEEWRNRNSSNSNFSFSILNSKLEEMLENGRVIDSYIYYIDNYDKNYFIYPKLQIICLNNLLNYNIFASVICFLILISDSSLSNNANSNNLTQEIIVQTESANRILMYEISKYDTSIQNEIILLIQKKNYSICKLEDDNDNDFNIKTDLNTKQSSISSIINDIICKFKKILNEFQNLIIQKDNSTFKSDITFHILKKLEDATDKENDFEINYDDKGVTLDSSWHLVSQFCKVNNYEMIYTFLHNYAKNNNWILFLYKSQEQDCQPQTIKQILYTYFKNKVIANHISIIISKIENENENKKEISEEEFINTTVNDGVYENLDASISLSLDNNLNTSLNKTNFNEVANINMKIVEEINNKNIESNKMNECKKIYIHNKETGFIKRIIYNFKKRRTLSTIHSCDQLLCFNINLNKININTNTDYETASTKFVYLLNESVMYCSKELLLSSLIYASSNEDIFTSFILYLYLLIQEILSFEMEENEIIYKNFNHFSLQALKNIYDPNTKTLSYLDAEIFIKFLLLNGNIGSLNNAISLFSVSFLDEFALFCKEIHENNYEKAYIHLNVYKNIMIQAFIEIKNANNTKIFDDLLIKINEVEYFFNDEDYYYEESDLINNDVVQLLFIFKVCSSTIDSLLNIYSSDSYKSLFILECLYQSSWSRCYSLYYLNAYAINKLNLNKYEINLKSHPSDVIKNLIKTKNFEFLSEYYKFLIENKYKDYHIDKEDISVYDDSWYYRIKCYIESFEMNYNLYDNYDRINFWLFIRNEFLNKEYDVDLYNKVVNNIQNETELIKKESIGSILNKNRDNEISEIIDSDEYSFNTNINEFVMKSISNKDEAEKYLKKAERYKELIQNSKLYCYKNGNISEIKIKQLIILDLYIKSAKIFLEEGIINKYSMIINEINHILNKDFIEVSHMVI